MRRAIEDLRNEHEAILFTLSALEGMAARAGAGESLEEADPANLLAVLREFADACHHGKEEGILFPALEVAGIPREGGPIGQMLAEHSKGRAYIAAMDGALKGGPDRAAFARAAGLYIELLRGHIRVENEVLFPMAERAVGAEAWGEIARRFDEHEETVIGRGRHEELHAILAGFEKKYVGR